MTVERPGCRVGNPVSLLRRYIASFRQTSNSNILKCLPSNSSRSRTRVSIFQFFCQAPGRPRRLYVSSLPRKIASRVGQSRACRSSCRQRAVECACSYPADGSSRRVPPMTLISTNRSTARFFFYWVVYSSSLFVLFVLFQVVR